jgi:hypothetical protein
MDDDLRPEFPSDALGSLGGARKYCCQFGLGTLMRHAQAKAGSVGALPVSMIESPLAAALESSAGPSHLGSSSLVRAAA